MKIAVLDIGSNTTKMSVFQLEKDGFSQFYYNASYTYLITHIENDLLNCEGIKKLCQVVSHFKQVSIQLKCAKLECFSTASLRYIKNIDDVITQVYNESKVRISPLTGEMEAHYNFLSMQQVAKEDTFLGGDLGGGSLQLFSCVDSKEEAATSLPVGALKMYKDFVKDTFPTLREAQNIKNYVITQLNSSVKFSSFSCKDLYMMGGTVRMICSLISENADSFSAEELNALLTGFLQNTEFARLRIEETVPERITTILPGMLVILTICEQIKIEKIHYTQSSVREGYLLEKYLRRKD